MTRKTLQFVRTTALMALAGVCARAQTTPLVVNTPVECATSVDGSVVGTPNPLAPPTTAVVYSGTLPSGNYFVEVAWVDASGNVTLVSPEKQVQLTASGEIQVSSPAGGPPATAAAMRVYIGASSGTETLQGTATPPSAGFTQSSALSSGAAPPSTNSTICQIVANDAGWPTGTGYTVSLNGPGGDVLPGYPMQWQLLGPGQTIDLNKGLPIYNGQVTYPIPILAQPYNHAAQSISGPLSMSGYNLVNVGKLGIGTDLPAWGVDAEATPNNTLEGMINASNGYLINGNGGTAGQCILSDGTAFDTPATCLTSLPTLYYQTIDFDSSPLTQRPVLAFSPRFNVTDSASPAATNVELAVSGATAGSYTSMNATIDQYGRVTAAANGGSSTSTFTNCLTTACAGGVSCPTTSTYAAGTLYTNCATHPVTETVTAVLSGTSGTGGQYTLPFTNGGVSFAGQQVANACNNDPPATVTFRVAPGATFSVSPTVVSTCSPAGTWTIAAWGETSY
jgi:hypothetical protein